MTPTIGSVVANKFQLVRELGRGSMGAVWLADHLTLDVRCAVKFMTGDASHDPNFLSRFEFEARAIAQLQSPYVVRVLDYAIDHDVPFIAMEFLQGEDLCARLSHVGRLDRPTTYRIVSQIARGLVKAHLAGVVHRDLKPENIFLAQEDDGEVAKLLDFGVAKSTAFAVHGTATQAGSLLGTPTYMSPEQARGLREIDHRADLWSLAVITYQCLTGKLPFDSPTLGDLFALIMYEPMPVPTKVAPWLPPDFDAWWAKAAARRVEDRFSTARELADALGTALGLAPAITGDSRETWRGAMAPVVLPPPEPPEPSTRPGAREDVASTQAPLTRSLRGARQLIESPRARYVAACTGAVTFAFLFALLEGPAGSGPAVARATAPIGSHASPPSARLAAESRSPAARSAPPPASEAPLPSAPLPASPLSLAASEAPPPARPAVEQGRSVALDSTGVAVPSVAKPPPSPARPPVLSRSAAHKSGASGSKATAADDIDFGI